MPPKFIQTRTGKNGITLTEEVLSPAKKNSLSNAKEILAAGASPADAQKVLMQDTTSIETVDASADNDAGTSQAKGDTTATEAASTVVMPMKSEAKTGSSYAAGY